MRSPLPSIPILLLALSLLACGDGSPRPQATADSGRWEFRDVAQQAGLTEVIRSGTERQ